MINNLKMAADLIYDFCHSVSISMLLGKDDECFTSKFYDSLDETKTIDDAIKHISGVIYRKTSDYINDEYSELMYSLRLFLAGDEDAIDKYFGGFKKIVRKYIVVDEEERETELQHIFEGLIREQRLEIDDETDDEFIEELEENGF